MTVKTVKASGGDYSSISAFEAAAPSTLAAPYEAECDNFALDDTTAFSGITTSSANYIRIAAAAGAQHDGRSRDVSGTGFQVSQSLTVAVFRLASLNHIRFEGLDIKQSGTSGAVAFFGPFASGSDIRFTNCIIHDVLTGNGYTLAPALANMNITLTNTIVYGHQRSINVAGCASAQFQNCIFWRHADQLGLVADAATTTKNCYSGRGTGSTECFWTGGTSPSGNNNASSDTSAATDYTSSFTGIAGSSVFTSVTPGAEDFTLKSGTNALVDAGATLSVANDIIGTSRPQGSAWDIGAFERQSTGVTGTVDASAQAPTASAAATLDETGIVDATAAAPGADVHASLDESAAIDASAPGPMADVGARFGDATADIAASAGAPDASVTATLDESAAVDASAPSPDAAVAATSQPPEVSGDVDASAPAPGADVQATLDESVAIDASAPAPTAEVSATETPPGFAADVDASAPAPVADAQATLDESAAVAADAAAPEAAVDATFIPPPIAGTVDATVAAPGADVAARLDEQATVDASAPAPQADVQAQFSPPGVAGQVDATVSGPAADVVARLDESATIDAQAPHPGADVAASLDEQAAVAASAPSPEAEAQATLDETAVVDADAPAPESGAAYTGPIPFDRDFAVVFAARRFAIVSKPRPFSFISIPGAPMQRIGPKTPYERRPITADFKRHLDVANGEILVADNMSASAVIRDGAAYSDLIDGAPQLVGDSVVRVWCAAGDAEVDYEISFKAETNLGAKLEDKVRLFATEKNI